VAKTAQIDPTNGSVESIADATNVITKLTAANSPIGIAMSDSGHYRKYVGGLMRREQAG